MRDIGNHSGLYIRSVYNLLAGYRDLIGRHKGAQTVRPVFACLMLQL